MEQISVVKDFAYDAFLIAGGMFLTYAGKVTGEMVPAPVRMGISLVGAVGSVLGGHSLVNDIKKQQDKKAGVAKDN